MSGFLKIKKYHVQRNMTQEELAEKAGLSVSYIFQVEKGKKRLGRVGLEKVAEALNVPVSLLVQADINTYGNSKQSQIIAELDDCNEYELNVIYDMVLHLKESLRKNR